jgi:hypothetical protein
MPLQRKSALPALRTLHERHPAFYPPICQAYADAAALCFGDSHVPPIDIEVTSGNDTCLRELAWDTPDENAHASWANRDDATRDGAYSVSLAAVEAELAYVALERADVRTGADYFVGPPGSDLEGSSRLEVSGVRTGDARDVRSRLRQKTLQAGRGRSDRPALACVVGFAARIIVLSRVNSDAEP